MYGAKRRRRGREWRQRCILVCLCAVILSTTAAFSALGPQDVLILVNENSPTSKYIAKLYLQYYTEISESQVLNFSGLTDCSGPDATAADEIITREQYEQLIAQPIRNYLTDSNFPERIAQVKVIITTAGMPYRIEDTVYGDAIYPGGSNPSTVVNHIFDLNAASVESELTCLWYSDYFPNNKFGLSNRMVNPYQGYRCSPVEQFERVQPDTKTMIWGNYAIAPPWITAPKMEGEQPPSWPLVYGTINRNFHAGDMYLTCRLDGPKDQGKSAVFAVRAMLERAKRASNPAIGVNPLKAVAVFDDAPGASNLDQNPVFNIDDSANYWVYDPDENQPPDVRRILSKDDYVNGFIAMTSQTVDYSGINFGMMEDAEDILIILDRRTQVCTTQTDLDDYAATDPNRTDEQGLILLATYGYNGDEGNPQDYLLHGGSGGGPLFNLVNGAVFASIESLNAVTMFFDVQTLPAPHHQGKIVDFIEIGGSGAIGHAFEPLSDAIIDNLYLQYNLLSDKDNDGIAELTFVEAAFTAIPYLSWAEVVIGDPLMRIAYGSGQKAWTPLFGDVNNDGRVNYADVWLLKGRVGGVLNTTDLAKFELYDDLYDVNKDGRINYADVWLAKGNLGAVADW